MRDKRTSPSRPRPDGQQQGLSPDERTLRARLAAHTMHAKHDGREITAAARAAFLARFEAEVDPDGTLPPEERRRRAEHARSAHFTRLAFEAAKAKRRKRDGAVVRMSAEDLSELAAARAKRRRRSERPAGGDAA